jgi:hypothetical protein
MARLLSGTPKRMRRINARGMALESGGLSPLGKKIVVALPCASVMLRHS